MFGVLYIEQVKCVPYASCFDKAPGADRLNFQGLRRDNQENFAIIKILRSPQVVKIGVRKELVVEWL